MSEKHLLSKFWIKARLTISGSRGFAIRSVLSAALLCGVSQAGKPVKCLLDQLTAVGVQFSSSEPKHDKFKDQFSSTACFVMFSMMIFVAPARSIMTDLPTSCNPLLS